MGKHIDDWQKGNESQMTSIQRLLLHTEWLKQQHKEVKDKILQRKKEQEGDDPPVVGFIKD